MTERIEPYLLVKHHPETNQTDISVVDPRVANSQIAVSDRKIFELYQLSIQYQSAHQPEQARECILLACQYAQNLQSRSAYAVLVGQLISLQLFEQLPALVELGQALGADASLAKIAPILAQLGQPESAIALVHSLKSEPSFLGEKIIALAQVAVKIAQQGNAQQAEQLINRSLQMVEYLGHGQSKVKAELAIQLADAGLYERAITIAQTVLPAVRRSATLAKITTLRSTG